VEDWHATSMPSVPAGHRLSQQDTGASTGVGGGSMDGVACMKIKETSAYVEGLPQSFANEAALSTLDVTEGSVSTDAAARREFLHSALELAQEGSPFELSVRELIAKWGAKSRSRAISRRINGQLKRNGLLSRPDFRKVGLDSQVSLEMLSGEDFVPEDETETAGEDTADNGAVDEVGITLGNLPSATSGVKAIKPQASLDEAITVMLLNDYSQLAVMSGSRTFTGAVTWQSIARGRHAKHEATLADAVVRADVLPYDTELIDALQTLQEKDFVFVKDQTNVVTGIVTNADVVKAYGELATPFLLIGELDQLLRRVISKNFSLKQVITLCDEEGNRRLLSYDDLSIGDYERVLQNPGNWAALRWPLDRGCFVARLTELREVRNDIMHFNPDPVSDGVVAKIRYMVRVLKDYV